MTTSSENRKQTNMPSNQLCMTERQIELVLLQRTQFLKKPDNICRAYRESIERDYQQIKPFLPQKAKHVIDLGCGLAGFTLTCFWENCFLPPIFHLVDINRVDVPKYGYNKSKDTSAYCLWVETIGFLLRNGVNAQNIEIYNADTEEWPNHVEIDAIVSLFSCGFHYPIGVYMEKIEKTLKKSGVFIFDLRKGTEDQLELYKNKWNFAYKAEGEKHWRTECRRK